MMKLLVIFTCTFVVASALTTEEHWKNFKQSYGKTYKSLREDKIRYEVFSSNLRTIEEHNDKYKKGEKTWFMAVNQFTDLTNEEFKTQHLSHKPSRIEFAGNFSAPPNFVAPDSVDWRQKGVVLPVRNEGKCGSCWAFSATGALEGQNAIKHGIKVELSPQELVDCSHLYENFGCEGGLTANAYKYIHDHGISTLADYPYEGVDGKCRAPTHSGNIKLKGFKSVQPTEEQLKLAVASVGPISAAIDATSIQHYGGGIFNDFFCGHTLDHGVLVVGYGIEDIFDFWIVKNNWGDTWGERGYIRMTRNRFNQCSIASGASYPEIE